MIRPLTLSQQDTRSGPPENGAMSFYATEPAEIKANILGLLRDPKSARRLRRDDLVPHYIALIRASSVDECTVGECGEVNEAIIARWSVSGLDYIKKQAWSRVYQRRKRAAPARPTR